MSHLKTILVIEDNNDIRNNTAEILELSNYNVIVAENGKVGVEKAIAHAPDLIICDIMMPELDGYGVLHAIHRNEKIKNTPFIFLTAKAERNDFRKAMELGADDFITKPFDVTELLNAVDGRLKKLDILKQDLGAAFNDDIVSKQALPAEDFLKCLIEDRDTNRYKKKQTIFSAGNHPTTLFYVLHGRVKTYICNDDGKELVTELYTPGDFLGYTALLGGTVHKDTAEAMEETELAIIPKDDFEKLINNNSQVSRQFISLLAKNVASNKAQLVGLAYNSLRKKVAEALLLLQNKYHNGDEQFSIDISRDNLAAIAGTATESLIRTLSDFKNEKLIDISGGTITILNTKKLEQLFN